MGMSFIGFCDVTITPDFLGINDDLQADVQIVLHHPAGPKSQSQTEIIISLRDKEEYKLVFCSVKETLMEYTTTEHDDEIRFTRFPIVISYTGEESLDGEI